MRMLNESYRRRLMYFFRALINSDSLFLNKATQDRMSESRVVNNWRLVEDSECCFRRPAGRLR